jgi:hypothetical protein
MSAPFPCKIFELPHRQHVDHGQFFSWKQRGIFENFAQHFALAWKLPARAPVGENHVVIDDDLIDAIVAFN